MLLEQLPAVLALSPADQRRLAEELWHRAEEAEYTALDPAVLAALEFRVAQHTPAPPPAPAPPPFGAAEMKTR